MYKPLPSTIELLQALKPKKDEEGKVAKISRALLKLMGGGFFVCAFVYAAIKLGWTPPKPAAYVGIASSSVVFIAWVAVVLMDVYQNFYILVNPAKEMSDQLDREMAVEDALVLELSDTPTQIIIDRQQRLDLQIALWEKSIDVVRLVTLLGPPLILLVRQFPGIPETPSYIESIFSAALTGVLFGSFVLRSCMRRFHRLSHVLKRVSEQNSRQKARNRRHRK
jgi:hypothetical protein